MQQQVTEELLTSVLRGVVALEDLLADSFLYDLHSRMYGDIWSWAGKRRQLELNIGVAPDQITVELRMAFDNIRYRWATTDDWSARELGIAAHAEAVRVHPFTDGNGRSTRLLADLVFLAAQDPVKVQYDWNVNKNRYIVLLREFDGHRDPRDLAAFVGVRTIDG
ncbi:Fic family protein [Mycolicibacterium fortuitum]